MEFDKRRPIYEQVLEYFEIGIIRGDYAMGEALPSRREIAQQLNVNPNTVQRAFKEMEEMGLITTEANVPSRVTEDMGIINAVKSQLLSQTIEEFYQKIKALGLNASQVIQMLENHVAEKEAQDA